MSGQRFRAMSAPFSVVLPDKIDWQYVVGATIAWRDASGFNEEMWNVPPEGVDIEVWQYCLISELVSSILNVLVVVGVIPIKDNTYNVLKKQLPTLMGKEVFERVKDDNNYLRCEVFGRIMFPSLSDKWLLMERVMSIALGDDSHLEPKKLFGLMITSSSKEEAVVMDRMMNSVF